MSFSFLHTLTKLEVKKKGQLIYGIKSICREKCTLRSSVGRSVLSIVLVKTINTLVLF